ncbi:MAG: ammonia-forming cytochrome c nitrite reductase [Ignavibacteriales bacterium]|nr:ammonia-forming cytochrome c nitrite reductase [Ignavibacteriales bacterium]
MKPIVELIKEKPIIGWLIFGGTIVAVFLIGLLGASIMERRSEEKMLFQLVKPIAEWEPRNEVWGENFPREFESYKSTFDTTFKSKYGGSATRDLLEEDPNPIILWAGNAFSRDYNQARGHYRAIEDIRKTLRTGLPQPATCWTCKSTDVPRVMNKIGIAEYYHKKYTELGSEITNNIGCQDCHDPATMNLRITRPALAEAFQRQGKDITKATHQEMRSLVCAQCHVEYYFKGDGKYLTFPWDNGFSAEQMETYYDTIQHMDFEHKLSKAKILKAQHPDYELYKTGIHAERGVSCADCHMPYRSEGGVKFTNHKIQSPLNDIAASCGVCHRESEATLRKNVEDRQDKILELRLTAEQALVKAHLEAKFAWEKGATEEEMKPVLQFIRHAQWRWDWVAASNGLGFHSPTEAARVLGSAIQQAGEARVALVRILAKHGVTEPFVLPDISTKEKAQTFIGLKMDSLRTEKTKFLQTVAPEWDKKAEEREGKKRY